MPAPSIPDLSGVEVAKHNSRSSCWIVVHGTVWDVTAFLSNHPGGASLILGLAGQDATESYSEIHPPDLIEETLGTKAMVGTADPATIPSLERKIDLRHETPRAPPLRGMLNLDDFGKLAEATMKPTTWAYVAGGADDEVSVRSNRKAYRKIYLRPRILRNVSTVDSSATILGKRCTMPIYVSPVGLAKLVHPDGECAIAAACGKEGTIEVVNTVSSMPIEDIMNARVSKDQPVFWQLYVDKDLSKSEAFIKRVQEAGVSAIWLTVDSPVVGKRERDDRAQLQITEEVDEMMDGQETQGIAKAGTGFINASIDWEIIDWLRGVTKLPIVIKGISSVEDAIKAFESGIDGIVLSNHGGRSQDTAQPPILTLLEIRKYAPQIIGKGMQIFVDGGIRRGTDVLKALALGATAVGIGRPVLYSMTAGYGERGVRRMFQILRQELQINMALAGASRVEEISYDMVNTSRLERDLVGSFKL